MEVVDDLKENQEPDSSPSYYHSKRGPNLDSDSENPKSMSEDEQSGSASSPSQQRDSSTRENVEPKLPENAPTEKSSNLHPNSSSTMHSSQQQLLELREFGSIPPDDVASSTVSNRRMGMDADNSFALSSAEGHLPDSNLSLSSSSQPPDGSFGRVIYGVHRASSARPVHKLSVALLTTYKEINRKYYERQRLVAGLTDSVDDADGNYVPRVDHVIANRYHVKKKLGKGSFGVVVLAYDSMRDRMCAIKVIKNRRQFYKQALVELDILTKLNRGDPEDVNNVVRVQAYFDWKSHLCFVFELLDLNLYDVLKRTHFKGLSLPLVRKIGIQILRTLRYLRELNIIHCDLKPENILLRNRKHSAVKIVDFGSSCYTHGKMYKYIQSRFYRSPEVMLGLPYSMPIDMWSLGCILVELHTGSPLFDGANEVQQLHKVMEICNLPSVDMLSASSKSDKFFFRTNEGRFVPIQLVRKRTLEQILNIHNGGPRGLYEGKQGHSVSEYESFISLISSMLQYDPDLRVKPEDAIFHPFFIDVDIRTDLTEEEKDSIAMKNADILRQAGITPPYRRGVSPSASSVLSSRTAPPSEVSLDLRGGNGTEVDEDEGQQDHDERPRTPLHSVDED